MGLETGTYVSDLVTTNPISTDPRSQGDDHLRLVKTVLQASFPNANRAFRSDRYTAKTLAYTVADTDQNNTLACATAGGAFLVTLPTTFTTSQDGFKVRIIKSDNHANALTVGLFSGTINGVTTLTLSYIYDAIICEWTGTAWVATVIPAAASLQGALTSHSVSVAGTVDVITAVFTPTILAWTTNLRLRWKSGGANTVTAPTFNPDGLSAKTIKKGANVALVAGDTGAAGYECEVVYNGTDLILLNPATALNAARTDIANTFAVLQTFTSGITSTGAAIINETVTIADDFVAPPVTLADDVTIAWDMSTGMNFTVTLGGNRTLNAPTGETAGQFGLLFVVQDGTGSRTLTWDASYKFPNGTDEKPSPTASSTTCYEYYSRGANDIIVKKRWQSASNSIGFFKEYELDTAINDNNLYTQAHGLGRYPALVQLMLENTITDGEWAVGDRMFISAEIAGSSGTNNGVTVCANTTNVLVAFSTTVTMVRKTTNDRVTITEANWKPVLRVYE